MQNISSVIIQLRDWAITNQKRPQHTTFHVAALLYRNKILINHKTGKIMACINQVSMCAERMLLKLCE